MPTPTNDIKQVGLFAFHTSAEPATSPTSQASEKAPEVQASSPTGKREPQLLRQHVKKIIWASVMIAALATFLYHHLGNHGWFASSFYGALTGFGAFVLAGVLVNAYEGDQIAKEREA